MRRFFYNIADESLDNNITKSTDISDLKKLSEYQQSEQLRLPDSVYHHWCRVLRAKVNDSAYLFDGFGGSYEVMLSEITKKYALVEMGAYTAADNTPDMYTQIGLVMSRGDRMDYAIQKATEMGVTSIQLLTSEYGELRLKSSQVEKKLNHWQQVAISACEQCCLNRVPLIMAPKAINEWSQQQISPIDSDNLSGLSSLVQHLSTADYYQKLNNTADLSLMLSVVDTDDDSAHTSITNLFLANNHAASHAFVKLLIGAEGGLSVAEEQTALANNWLPWQIGKRILRTETAPVVALANLQTLSRILKNTEYNIKN